MMLYVRSTEYTYVQREDSGPKGGMYKYSGEAPKRGSSAGGDVTLPLS